MPRIRDLAHGIERRVAPAVLSAAGVTLLAAGLLAYTAPAATSFDAPSPVPSALAGLTPEPSPTASAPAASADASAEPSPVPSAEPTPTGTASPSPGAGVVATRIVVPALKIDIPIVSGSFDLPGNSHHYPLCDVAAYLTSYSQPGRDGTTYLYAHAQAGMFLPLLEASLTNNGKSMIGYAVLVYTSDDHVYWYSISKVKRHAHDFSLADDVAPGTQQLIMQTSEGPFQGWSADPPKLQVLASFQLVQPASHAEANPTPHPRVCLPGQ